MRGVIDFSIQLQLTLMVSTVGFSEILKVTQAISFCNGTDKIASET